MKKFNSLVVFLLCSFLFTSMLQAKGQSSHTQRFIPIEEWTWIPHWSTDGKFIAIRWPAPPLVTADGKIEREIIKQKSTSGMAQAMTPTLTTVQSRPVTTICNFEQERTLILKADTFERLPFEIPFRIYGEEWSPNNKWLAGDVNELHGVAIFNSSNGKLFLRIPEKSAQPIQQISWSPDSLRIAVSDWEGVHIWDIRTKKLLFTLPDLEGECKSVKWSPSGDRIAACGGTEYDDYTKNTVAIYSTIDGRELKRSKTKTSFSGIEWNKTGTLVAYADDSLHILDAISLRELKTLKPSTKSKCVEFEWAPSGRLIAYRGNDSDLLIVDVESWNEICKISAEKTGRYSFDWSLDGNHMLISDRIENFAVCNAKTGKYLWSKKITDLFSAQWSFDSSSLIGHDYKESVRKIELTEMTVPNHIVENPWSNQKVLLNLDDCYPELSKFLGKEGIVRFRETKEEELYRYTGGPSFAMQLRNTWGLREETPLVSYFNNLGLYDPRGISDTILQCYWRHLNDKPIELEKIIATYNTSIKPPKEISRLDWNKAASLNLNLKVEKHSKLEPFTLSSAPGDIKVLIFSNLSSEYLKSTQRTLCELAGKYPAQKVSVYFIKFKAREPNTETNKENLDVELKRALKAFETCKSRIQFSWGTDDQWSFLKNLPDSGLTESEQFVQSFIVCPKSKHLERFNGQAFLDYAIKILERRIDKILKRTFT